MQIASQRVQRCTGGCRHGSRPAVNSLVVNHRHRRPRASSIIPEASSGDGGIISGGSGIGGGSGKKIVAFGDDQPEKKGFSWKGWEDRVAYDPEFAFKVMLEQVIGVGAAVIGDMAGRPNFGLDELDFVFATVVVGSIVNFLLMYLLAPTAATAANPAAMGLIQRLLSDQFLKKWGAPGGNMFEPGFAVGKRLINFGYKGLIFAAIGFLAGLMGTTISNALIQLRLKLDPEFEVKNEQPNIIYNAATWGLHLGVSSNLRYQILGGTDQILQKAMPLPMFRTYSAIIRGLNNVVGGISFVTLARALGVQKAAA